MKHLKLFPKIFLYTLLLMVFITSVALGTTYVLGTFPMGKDITAAVSITPIEPDKSAPWVKIEDSLTVVTPETEEKKTSIVPETEEKEPSAVLHKVEQPTTEELTSILQPTDGVTVSAFYSINADTNVAVPAQNVVPAAPMTESTPAGSASLATTPAVTYSLVRFGSLVGSTIAQAVPWVLGFCVVLSALCALIFSRMIANPIRKISAVTEEMSALEPAAACPVSSGDEIGALAGHVNALYGSLLANIQSLEEEKRRVEASEKSKVDFLRSASHELKTPVTALGAMMENMTLKIGKYKDYDVYLPRCKEMCDRLSAMIRDILEASRLQSAEDAQPLETVELAPYLEHLCAPYEELAELDGLRFTVEAEGEALLPPKAFSRALSNLLGNAVTYTPKGGQITLRCDKGGLTLENTCTPIPPEQLEHIFEAFYRPDWSRDRADGGNGLGLYITAGILKGLGMTYAFVPNESGDGMIFSVSFISA